ncbi:MAG: catechol 2,3-dioxygenase-like lactoylglutathione lyase family enzyme [Bermanella sp.]|jgi:catechol 2,3-dioxygenase-like lactoylglutathione lyase family enzyme
MSAQLTHIALHVLDMQASLDFYSQYCGLRVCHKRTDERKTIVWMAEPGRETEFILVLIPGGPGRPQADNDFSHLGYALDSQQAVDDIARRATQGGCLLWPPRQADYPVGYYCGLRDPDGNAVEFSYGQPLGPGARDKNA